MTEFESTSRIIDKLSKVVGECDIAPDTLLLKLKDIKDWNVILQHQKLLGSSHKRDISIQAALIDYIINTELKASETHELEMPAEQKTAYTSIIDSLTGLYNDKHFQTILEAELKRAKQYELPLSLIMFDIDDFATYTAMFGPDTGDIVLKEITLIMKKSCRKEDMLFHLRRNRFILLLLNINREGAHRLGERLRENIESHHFQGEEKLPSKKITVSGGIAIYPDDSKNPNNLVMAAEEALATAKQSGKNRMLEYSMKRRKAPRVNTSIDAKYQIEGRKDLKPQSITIKNISESGVLVTAKKDIPLGGNIVLEFKPYKNLTIRVNGETVRISSKEGAKEISAAIKFVDISQEDLNILKGYIQENLKKQ